MWTWTKDSSKIGFKKRPDFKKYNFEGYTADLENYCDGLEIAVTKLMDQIDLYTKDSPLEKLPRDEWLERLVEED